MGKRMLADVLRAEANSPTRAHWSATVPNCIYDVYLGAKEMLHELDDDSLRNFMFFAACVAKDEGLTA